MQPGRSCGNSLMNFRIECQAWPTAGTIPPGETDGELGTMKLLWGNSDPETNMFAKTELVGPLVSENPETRVDVMRRLGITGEDDLLPFLSECLTHSYDKLQSAAARVLADMGDDSVLFSSIADFGSSDFGVRFDAERAILEFDPGHWSAICSTTCSTRARRSVVSASMRSMRLANSGTSARYPF